MADPESVPASDASEQPTHHSDLVSCPECETAASVVTDGSTDETYCQGCGLVLSEVTLHRGPDWFDTSSGSRRRTGAPLTDLRHDRGLSAEIGWRTDGKGNPLSGKAQLDLRRKRRLNSQARFDSKQKHNLAQGLVEIQRIASALDLSESVTERAGRLFRSAVAEGLLPGRSIEAFATASVYAACRLQRLPWFFEEIAEVARVEEHRVRSAYRTMNRELGLSAPPPLPQDYLSRIAADVDAPADATRYARTLLELPAVSALANGRNPCSVTAGCLYFAVRETHGRGPVSQAELAEAARVSAPSLRTIWHALNDLRTENPETFSFLS